MAKLAKSTLLLALVTLILASAQAQTLSGTVTNATTNKPAAGDEVILINLANGMDVAGSTKADSSGKFSFKLDASNGAGGPHLIRAVHQGVTYHQIAPPGTNSVEVKVYDVAKKVEGLSLTADVFRLQADTTSMQGIRLFAVNNATSVTQMNDHNFEFYLPPGAKVEQLQARAPNGQPISAEAVPQSEKGRYAVAFPLRPGETQFQLEFTVPYSGQIKIDPKPLYPAEHFVVVLPKTMHFSAAGSSAFKSMDDPNQSDTMVEVAQQTRVGQPLAFTVSGTGTISEQPAQTAAGSAGSQAGGPMNENPQTESTRPGGGLGAPIDAPDPLEKYRWPIIGAFIVLLAIGAWIVTKRQTGIHVSSESGAVRSSVLSAPIVGPGSAAISGSARKGTNGPTSSAASSPAAMANFGPAFVAPASKSAMILEALKEELFQLEVERKQGKISADDYEKAKAALDQTLDRALKRQA